MVVSQILLDGALPHDAGTSWLSSPVRVREANWILLPSALSTMHAVCQLYIVTMFVCEWLTDWLVD